MATAASANLEALTEEDYEESVNGTKLGETSEPRGLRKDEPSQFETLCDGVLNSLALVHSSLTQVLSVKDEIVHHHLPPNVLSKVTLSTAGLFRSVSDLHMPVNELVRLVRIYSTPWQEKSTALKKLHEDYAVKKAQLNAAVRRLELNDAQSKRVQKAQIVMNWEKLFAKLVSAKGHGRRWKFLIEPFKRIVKAGPQKVHEYIEGLNEGSSDEEDAEQEDVATQLQRHDTPGQDSAKDEDVDGKDSSDEDDEEDAVSSSTNHKPMLDGDGDEESLAHKSTDSKIVVIKVPTQEQAVWTDEPAYERYLVTRVYPPEGLEDTELKCSIIYANQRHVTNRLDDPVQQEVATEVPETKSKDLRMSRIPPAPKPEPAKPSKPTRYEECRFLLPEGEVQMMKYSKRFVEQHLKVAIHTGTKEEMIAMATVDMQDLEHIDIGEVVKPPPVGDDPEWDESGTAASIMYGDLWKQYQQHVKNIETNMEVIRFPLYSIHPSKNDSHAPCGSLPLSFYWLSQQIPQRFNRLVETENLRDVILDILGVDLYTTSKDDLHKEMHDEALSAISFTPEVTQPEEETVLKSDYDKLRHQHEAQLLYLQKEYENRLQEVMESLQQAEEAAAGREMALQQQQLQMQAEMQTQMQKQLQQYQASMKPRASPHPKSAGSSSVSGHTQPVIRATVVEPALPQPPAVKAKTSQEEEKSFPVKKTFKTGKALPNWGEHLPKDFLDRLQMFEEETNRRRQELMSTLQCEISENLEKALASQYKLQPSRPKSNNAQDVSLPAVFMPTKSKKAMIYNPRAHNYFHPTGSGGVRLTQPPSMLQLPPLPKNKLSVVNLFQLSNTLQPIHGEKPGEEGTQWLMQRYLDQTRQTEDGNSPGVPVPSASSLA